MSRPFGCKIKPRPTDDPSGRVCCTCKQWKSREHFTRLSAVRCGLSSYCKECTKTWRTTQRAYQAAWAKKWRINNPERAREKDRRSKKRNLAKSKARNQKRYATDEFRARHREYERQRRRRVPLTDQQKVQRVAAQRGRRRLNAEKSRAEKLTRRALGPVSLEYIKMILPDPCSYCGKRGGIIDHIDAIAKGGTNDWTNLTAACRSCNAKKYTWSLLEFLFQRKADSACTATEKRIKAMPSGNGVQ
jgi:hypothetical protein